MAGPPGLTNNPGRQFGPAAARREPVGDVQHLQRRLWTAAKRLPERRAVATSTVAMTTIRTVSAGQIM